MPTGDPIPVKIQNMTGPVLTNTTWTGMYPNTSNFSYIYTTPTNHYFYQITCPKCNKMNWCELDKTVECEGKLPRNKDCKATLQAVSNQVDYQVPVK